MVIFQCEIEYESEERGMLQGPKEGRRKKGKKNWIGKELATNTHKYHRNMAKYCQVEKNETGEGAGRRPRRIEVGCSLGDRIASTR